MIEDKERINCVIVEDERLSAELLVLLIKEYYPSFKVVNICKNRATAEVSILRDKPSIVFLDMNLGKECGMDILESLKEFDLHVIITSGEDCYGVKAFKYNVVDYLLKPYDTREFCLAVQKALMRINERKHSIYLSSKSDELNRIGLPTTSGVEFVEEKDIIRIEAWGTYCAAHLISGDKVIVMKPMGTIEEHLDKNIFVRIHNSHIINKQRVKRLIKEDGGSLMMEDGSSVPFSRRKKDALFSLLKIF